MKPSKNKKNRGRKNMSIDELKIGKESEQEDFEPVDLSEFEGKKTRIDLVTEDWYKSKFHDSKKCKAVKVETEVITTIQVGEKDVEIRASELLNLKLDKESNEWVISPNKDSNLQKFMKHHSVKHPKDLFDKTCEITLRPKTNDSGKEIHFLGIKY